MYLASLCHRYRNGSGGGGGIGLFSGIRHVCMLALGVALNEVIMRVPQYSYSSAGGPLARRALIAVGFTPVIFGLALLAGFLAGQGVDNVLVGAVLSVIALIAPLVAVAFAIKAVRAGEPLGMPVAVGSGVVLMLVLLGLPFLVVGGGAFVLALTVCLLGVLFVVYGLNKGPAS